MENEFKQLCVWQGTEIPEGMEEDFIDFFKDNFNVKVKIAEVVLTNPDIENDKVVPETGGRSDILFWIATEDISKFAVKRLKYDGWIGLC